MRGVRRTDRKERVSPTARIVLFATTTSVVLGFLTVFVVVLADEPSATIRHHLLTLDGLLSLLFIGAFTSLPISVPAGLAGGDLAARVVAKQGPHRTLTSWTSRGAVWGAAIGAAGTVALFALPSVSTDTFPLLLLMMALVGGVTGGLVGALVGAYCSRVLSPSGARQT
jgi:hypothetical protein